MKGILRVLGLLRYFTLPFTGAIISLVIVNGVNLILPRLLGILIDEGINKLDLSIIWQVALALVGLAIMKGIFNFLQGYWSETTSQGIAFELRNLIFEKLQHLSFSYHDRSQTGKLLTRMTSDVEMVRMFTGNGLLQLIAALILLFGTLTMLFLINTTLTLIFLGMLPFIAVIFFRFFKVVMPLSSQIQQKLGMLNTILQENLAGIRVVKSFAREDYEINRFKEKNQDYLMSNLTLVEQFSTFFPLFFFIANLAIVGVVWVGGIKVIGGTLTLGNLVAFLAYQGFFLMPIFMFGFIGSVLGRAEASAIRIFEVLDAQSDVVDKPDAYPLPPIKGHVVFENVTFRYPGSDQDVCSNLSFEAKPNQTIAIIGKTGAGKSSIINLIPRFYNVSSGRILIDGHNIADVTLSSLRSQIGIVLQETTLFSGSIRDNIAYGRPSASLEEVIEAAKIAQADTFIQELPDGYNTIIGERGVGLSGGQKQRIAIARAIILSPPLLIMDDSTSSVDSETEYQIQKALDYLRKNRTTFVIAQRINTVREADLILLLDQGKLVAQGTHDELIETCELYVEIMETQFGEKIFMQPELEEELR